MFGPVIRLLAANHQVILPDLQGHGRTADIDRPLDIRLMADDIAALIDHLGLDRPDVVGFSLGGGVAFFVASKYPEKVGKLVMASANIRRDAIPAEMLAQQEQVERRGGRVHEGHADVPDSTSGSRRDPRTSGAARQGRRGDGGGLRLLARRSAASRCRR